MPLSALLAWIWLTTAARASPDDPPSLDDGEVAEVLVAAAVAAHLEPQFRIDVLATATRADGKLNTITVVQDQRLVSVRTEGSRTILTVAGTREDHDRLARIADATWAVSYRDATGAVPAGMRAVTVPLPVVPPEITPGSYADLIVEMGGEAFYLVQAASVLAGPSTTARTDLTVVVSPVDVERVVHAVNEPALKLRAAHRDDGDFAVRPMQLSPSAD